MKLPPRKESRCPRDKEREERCKAGSAASSDMKKQEEKGGGNAAGFIQKKVAKVAICMRKRAPKTMRAKESCAEYRGGRSRMRVGGEAAQSRRLAVSAEIRVHDWARRSLSTLA
jgi:hypothetical protein